MAISPRVSVLPLVVVLCGCAARTPAAVATATPGASASTVRDTHEDLHAVLWMQTAAEYRALTSGIYAAAGRTLDTALADPSWTAAVEQTGAYQGFPPAVILDLDETVLDNSAFQGQLIRDRRSYSEDSWNEWVRARVADAVPGAHAFVHAAEGRGVRVFYVSNRAAAEEASTLANLRSLGFAATSDTVMLAGEHGWTSDKSARRESVARSHRVLMLVGDDLGDFVPVARLSPRERGALVDRYAERWLERWVLLPNPSYGSWARALTPGLTIDRDVLEQKMIAVRGYR
jgi:acid phosphatase